MLLKEGYGFLLINVKNFNSVEQYINVGDPDLKKLLRGQRRDDEEITVM